MEGNIIKGILPSGTCYQERKIEVPLENLTDDDFEVRRDYRMWAQRYQNLTVAYLNHRTGATEKQYDYVRATESVLLTDTAFSDRKTVLEAIYHLTIDGQENPTFDYSKPPTGTPDKSYPVKTDDLQGFLQRDSTSPPMRLTSWRIFSRVAGKLNLVLESLVHSGDAAWAEDGMGNVNHDAIYLASQAIKTLAQMEHQGESARIAHVRHEQNIQLRKTALRLSFIAIVATILGAVATGLNLIDRLVEPSVLQENSEEQQGSATHDLDLEN